MNNKLALQILGIGLALGLLVGITVANIMVTNEYNNCGERAISLAADAAMQARRQASIDERTAMLLPPPVKF